MHSIMELALFAASPRLLRKANTAMLYYNWPGISIFLCFRSAILRGPQHTVVSYDFDVLEIMPVM